jgi:hypothetical protein
VSLGSDDRSVHSAIDRWSTSHSRVEIFGSSCSVPLHALHSQTIRWHLESDTSAHLAEQTRRCRTIRLEILPLGRLTNHPSDHAVKRLRTFSFLFFTSKNQFEPRAVDFFFLSLGFFSDDSEETRTHTYLSCTMTINRSWLDGTWQGWGQTSFSWPIRLTVDERLNSYSIDYIGLGGRSRLERLQESDQEIYFREHLIEGEGFSDQDLFIIYRIDDNRLEFKAFNDHYITPTTMGTGTMTKQQRE